MAIKFRRIKGDVMYWLYKKLLQIIVKVYIYTLMFFIDVLFNSVLYIYARLTVPRVLIDAFETIKNKPYNIEKWRDLDNFYEWKADPLGGVINWNWRSIWVAALFKFKGDLRSRISQDIKSKGYTKKSKTELILGADWLTVKKHFERQFTKGMTWDNQGKWHIDHIVPLASAKTEEEVIKLNHYTNLQPLWAEDNLKKSDTIINGTQTTLGI